MDIIDPAEFRLARSNLTALNVERPDPALAHAIRVLTLAELMQNHFESAEEAQLGESAQLGFDEFLSIDEAVAALPLA